jgi:hypothetical protein
MYPPYVNLSVNSVVPNQTCGTAAGDMPTYSYNTIGSFAAIDYVVVANGPYLGTILGAFEWEATVSTTGIQRIDVWCPYSGPVKAPVEVPPQ